MKPGTVHGAAPVYRGDPGYAAHLDRDGDGVGCE
ncbi:excalibur calcium-binding domain-containing protein [Streptomyces sp. NPDC001984]